MINPINIFTQNYQINPVKTRPISQPNFLAPLMKDTVSFTGKKEDLIRTIGNVSCPCCGVKMLTDDDVRNIRKELSKEDSAKHYVNTLKPYEEYLHKPEKGVFKRFEAWSIDNPKKNLQTFMQENRDKSLVSCKQKQQDTFVQINTLTQSINQELGEKFKKLTDSYSKSPFNTEENMKDVRKWMLSDVENTENKIEDKETYKKLVKLADSLPISKNDSDAFIVRYASQPSSKVANRLVKLSAGTIEHIKPQANGGRDRIENYLLECGECNHTRGNISLEQWVKDHPEMKGNIQKYFDEVIAKINNGKIKGLDNYPNSVKGAIEAQSKGTLTYDTSKLKPVKNSNPKANNTSAPFKSKSLNLVA